MADKSHYSGNKKDIVDPLIGTFMTGLSITTVFAFNHPWMLLPASYVGMMTYCKIKEYFEKEPEKPKL